MRPILLFLHIAGGTLGILSGFAAMFLRKGFRCHRLAGHVFVISMLTMSACGTILAIGKDQLGNVFGGVVTFYMVATAALTARHRDGESGLLDWGALLFASAAGIGMVTLGLRVASNLIPPTNGVPTAMYFVFGSIALLSGAGDLGMLLRGGLSGSQRIVRHLWRMCFGLFIASASVFLARAQLFPALFQKTGALVLLTLLPLLVAIFWIIRFRLKKGSQSAAAPASAPHGQPATVVKAPAMGGV